MPLEKQTKLIRYISCRAAVRPATEPVADKSTENKITTPPPLNEESLQLQSIISDVSVITDPRLLIPAKTIKRVRLDTSEQGSKCDWAKEELPQISKSCEKETEIS